MAERIALVDYGAGNSARSRRRCGRRARADVAVTADPTRSPPRTASCCPASAPSPIASARCARPRHGRGDGRRGAGGHAVPRHLRRHAAAGQRRRDMAATPGSAGSPARCALSRRPSRAQGAAHGLERHAPSCAPPVVGPAPPIWSTATLSTSPDAAPPVAAMTTMAAPVDGRGRGATTSDRASSSTRRRARPYGLAILAPSASGGPSRDDRLPRDRPEGRQGRAARQGDMARATVYGDDPAAQARVSPRPGADHLHVVDLDGAFAGHRSTAPRSRRSSRRSPARCRSAAASAIAPASIAGWRSASIAS